MPHIYEGIFFKEIIDFHCMANMATSEHKNSSLGGHAFYNLM